MTQDKIDRINFLARKSKKEGLSEAEKEEQQKLRREYIDGFKASLRNDLENTVVINPDGTRFRLSDRRKK